MGLKSTWQENQQVRRAVMGALAGMLAGITAAGIDGSVIERYSVAIVIGIIAFIGLMLLLD